MSNGEENEMDEIMKIINKKYRNRNQNENSILYEFMVSTNFQKELKSDLLLGEIDEKTLFFFMSQFMEILYFQRNEVIYYEGKTGDFLYLLLAGKLNQFKLGSEKVKLTAPEYYEYLHKEYEKGNKFILEQTVKKNNSVLPVRKMLDVPEMMKILRKVRLAKIANDGNVETINEFLYENGTEEERTEFDKVVKGDDTVEDFLQTIVNLMTEIEAFYYKYCTNEVIEVEIVKYIPSNQVYPIQFFGNYKLGDTDNKRAETSIADDDCTVIAINKKQYGACIINEKRNIREMEIERIHQNTFFQYLRKATFAKKFFYELDLIELTKGEYLYKEDDTVEYIYIIKEGNFEVTMEGKNIFDIKNSIKMLKDKEEELQKEEYDDIISLKNSFSALLPLTRQRNNYSLFVMDKGVFGVFEFYYKMPAICNVQVLTDKAKLFRLSVNKLIEEENEYNGLLQKGIKKEANDKIKLFYERLIMIKNNVLMKYDFDFGKSEKEKSDEYYNKLTVVNEKKNMVNNLRKMYLNYKDEKKNVLDTSIKNIKEYKGFKFVKAAKNNENLNLSMKNQDERKKTRESIMLMNIKKNITSLEKNKSSKRILTLPKIEEHKFKGKFIHLPIKSPKLKKKSDDKLNNRIEINGEKELQKYGPQKKNINYLVVRKFYDENQKKFLHHYQMKKNNKT